VLIFGQGILRLATQVVKNLHFTVGVEMLDSSGTTVACVGILQYVNHARDLAIRR